ncbi:hypothetical protein [Mycobacterium lehmannii]|uniref:hypothetical protein n=1 Tax=Mycobacterium lehmannii TaxID=2048550 RepID=UPI000B9460C1|nr:hypothetical protein [Mycobacterium lehmannii]
MSDMIRVNPAAIVDYNAALNTFSGELDGIAAQAQNLLAGISEYFTTEQASVNYAQAQQMIIDATNEGKEVIHRHGAAADQAGVDWVSQDGASAATFMV